MVEQLKRDALNAFIDLGDRAQTPIFVGRDEIMSEILRLARRIHQHDPQTSKEWPAQGKMRLIQGAPGIGKTALLNSLRAHCRTAVDRPRNQPFILPVMIPEARDLSRDYMVTCIRAAIEAMNRDSPKSLGRGIVQKFVRLARRIQGAQVTGPAGIGVGVSLNSSATPIVPPPNCVILLMIDEVQTVPGAAGALLQYLEGGSQGLPVLPVLAGLSNSWKTLQDVALSRLSSDAIIQPGALNPNEVQQALDNFVSHFGITTTARTQDLWAGALWQWSRGWPKHMQNVLNIMGRHLLPAQGNLNALSPPDIQAHVITTRHAYYRQRLGPWTGHASQVGQVMARLGRDPVPEEQVETILRATGFVTEPGPKRSATMTTMLRLGLLDEVQAGSGHFACPIPSLRSFVVAQTGTALHAAVQTAPRRTITDLLQTEIPDETDAWGRTPLHLATQENRVAIVADLLQAGHDPAVTDHWGRNVLHVAAGNNATDVVSLLLTDAAAPHALDSDGCTPLHHAARSGSLCTLRQLLAAGSDAAAISHTGYTPLHEAAQANDAAGLQHLLAAGSSIQHLDKNGQTPLHWAARTNALDAVRTLLANGAHPDIRDGEGRLPGALAAAGSSVHWLLTPPEPLDPEADGEPAEDQRPDGPK